MAFHLLRTGLCRLDLFVQCFAIAFTQAMTALSVLIMCIVRMLYPESFIQNYDEISKNSKALIAALDANDEIAIELFVASLSMLIASVLLIIGLRRRSTSLIFPWIVIMTVELGGGIVVLLMKFIARGPSGAYSVGRILSIIIYYVIMMYFFYSVYSYYILLKREKRLERHASALGLSSAYPSSEMITFSTSTASTPAPSTRSHSRLEEYYYLDNDDTEESLDTTLSRSDHSPVVTRRPDDDDQEREINIITGTFKD